MGGSAPEPEIIEEQEPEVDLREVRALVEYAKKAGWIKHAT